MSFSSLSFSPHRAPLAMTLAPSAGRSPARGGPAACAAVAARPLVARRRAVFAMADSGGMADMLKPLAGNITFGAAAGFCAGLFLKKVGQVAAMTAGGLFLIFQAAAMKNWVVINWKQIDADFSSAGDLNKDGKVDAKDAKFAVSNTIQGLTSNMGVYGAGFAGGFVLGLKK